MAGHSLGGVMAQNYANGNSTVKGLVTMGSVLLRDNHTINKDGTTHWTFTTPTLSVNGTKDGLLRITRTAESWYHTNLNVEKAQNWMYPTVALEGVSHMGFMSGTPPSAVLKNDLVAEVSESVAHKETASNINNFFTMILAGTKKPISTGDTAKIL